MRWLYRTEDRLLIGLCLAAILVPFGFYICAPAPTSSASEKRALAAWPQWQWSRESVEQLPGRLEAYFNDHLAGREGLITAHNLVKFFVFHASPDKKVKIGRDGWLFYVRELTALKPFPAGKLADLQRDLTDKRDWLARRGVDFLFVAAPDKALIYREYLPDPYRGRARWSRMAQLEEQLGAKAGIPMLNLEPALRAGQARYPVFFKADTHWNSAGAYFAYRAIMDRLSRRHPELAPLPPEHFKLEPSVSAGHDLAIMMGIGPYLKESSYSTPQRYAWCAAGPLPVSGFTPGADLSHKPYALECPRGRLRLMVFGDSFFHYLAPFMSEHFARLVFAYGPSAPADLEHAVASEHPDIVIEERVNRTL